MQFEMRRLSADDGTDIYDMLQEIPVYENGFENNMNSRTFDEFQEWIRSCSNSTAADGWTDWNTPQVFFWLYTDGFPVGYGLLCHTPTDTQINNVRTAGYVVRASQRNKGYGTQLLGMLVDEARKMGIDKLMLTIQNCNKYSLKIALCNGGMIEETSADKTNIVIVC